MVTTEQDRQQTRVTLTPNRSLEWSAVKFYLLLFILPALIISIGWLAVGVWIILPFAGLELCLLAFFMYRVCYQNYRQQQIIINKNHVTVWSGIHTPEQTFEFPRLECYLKVSPPLKPMDSLMLTLVTDKDSIAIGDFLNNDDRQLARKSLTAAGLIECSNLWFKKR